jgi:hypothetical protein
MDNIASIPFFSIISIALHISYETKDAYIMITNVFLSECGSREESRITVGGPKRYKAGITNIYFVHPLDSTFAYKAYKLSWHLSLIGPVHDSGKNKLNVEINWPATTTLFPAGSSHYTLVSPLE